MNFISEKVAIKKEIDLQEYDEYGFRRRLLDNVLYLMESL